MKDKLLKGLLLIAAISIIPLSAGIIYSLTSESWDIWTQYHVGNFLTGTTWDASTDTYGAWPFIVGTLMTSFIALLICIPFSLSVALFTGEYFKGRKVAKWLSTIIDLLAGIPSIVYGLWGFYAVRPLLISLGVSAQGFGVLLASLVLAIMIIPYASSLSAEFLSMVPRDLKEAAYGMGATQWGVIRRVSFPVAGSGIFAAFILALGRALGETMAVTMLIGNTTNIPTHLGDTGNSMASIIANQFGEAQGLKLDALYAIGLVLFLLTMVINIIAKSVIKRLHSR